MITTTSDLEEDVDDNGVDSCLVTSTTMTSVLSREMDDEKGLLSTEMSTKVEMLTMVT